jgi:hypothetical protein
MQDSTVNSECGVLHVACVGAILKRIAIAIAIADPLKVSFCIQHVAVFHCC